MEEIFDMTWINMNFFFFLIRKPSLPCPSPISKSWRKSHQRNISKLNLAWGTDLPIFGEWQWHMMMPFSSPWNTRLGILKILENTRKMNPAFLAKYPNNFPYYTQALNGNNQAKVKAFRPEHCHFQVFSALICAAVEKSTNLKTATPQFPNWHMY